MDKENKILVNEIANLYGITSQTIHYYEKKNIIKPIRDFTNNYRYFHNDDIKTLGVIKKYRNADFTLEYAQEMCKTDSHKDIILKMKKNQESTLELIKHKQLIFNILEENINFSDRYNSIGNSPVLENISEQYILLSNEKEIIYQDDDELKKEATGWFKNLFFTKACSIYEKIDDENYKKIALGAIASKEIFDYFNLKLTKNVIKIDEGLSITSTAIVINQDDIIKEIKNSLYFIEEKNYKLRSKPIVKTLFSSKNNNNDYELFILIIIPIF